MNEKASTKNDHIFDPKKPEWLNGPTNFKINFEQFSDKDLYNYCKKVGFNARTWSRRFMATIPEVAKRRLYKKYGYCSIHEFASKMGSVSRDNVDQVLRVNEKFSEMPKMKALIGEVGLSKLKVVACIATKETDGFWAEKVKNMTKSSLEVYVREIKRKDNEKNNIGNDISITLFQPEISQKFPGEARAARAEISQEQAQIGIFDFGKSISQNSNDARVANPQNHDKKTFTIQMDSKTEFELRKFKQLLEKERKEPVDWNSVLKEMVKRATSESIKSATPSYLRTKAEKPTQPTAVSRCIPAKIKRELEQKYQGHCAYPNCIKPSEQIHHKDRFAIIKSHENLIPLCKIHHDFLHQSDRQQSDVIFNKFKSEKFVAS